MMLTYEGFALHPNILMSIFIYFSLCFLMWFFAYVHIYNCFWCSIQLFVFWWSLLCTYWYPIQDFEHNLYFLSTCLVLKLNCTSLSLLQLGYWLRGSRYSWLYLGVFDLEFKNIKLWYSMCFLICTYSLVFVC